VFGGVLRDSVKLFALTRYTSLGDTPLWRWQFQGNFPSYCPYIIVGHCPGSYSKPADQIWVSYPHRFKGGGAVLTFTPLLLSPGYGGAPQVDRSIAGFLRGYQLGGGYTPGPMYLLSAIAGLLGSVALVLRGRRKLTPFSQARQLALACLLFFATALTVLAISDFFEFSWRYQLPAIVTLPPAGALGIAVLIAVLRGPAAQAATPGSVPGRAEAPAPAPVPETPAVKTP
jgi:hypothetical protein